MDFSDEDGTFAVQTARNIIEEWVRSRNIIKPRFPDKFNEMGGVFVTISKYPGHDLRGCIGFPEPVYTLAKALSEAAISSASYDPRFLPMKSKELDDVVVEVSLLTPPKLLDAETPSEYPKQIEIGRDGLIAELGVSRGLLLPQVPVEWGWDAEEFLEYLCNKAGLSPSSWLDPRMNIYSFQAEIFIEESPRGNIVRKELDLPKEE